MHKLYDAQYESDYEYCEARDEYLGEAEAILREEGYTDEEITPEDIQNLAERLLQTALKKLHREGCIRDGWENKIQWRDYPAGY